jgi:hypothetical protein
MIDLDRDDAKLDIHHIFPRKWCEDRGVPLPVYNSIVNKTAISYQANRMIGGSAPSRYLEQLAEHPQVKLDRASTDAILETHATDPQPMRADAFEAFYATRNSALPALVACDESNNAGSGFTAGSMRDVNEPAAASARYSATRQT